MFKTLLFALTIKRTPVEIRDLVVYKQWEHEEGIEKCKEDVKEGLVNVKGKIVMLMVVTVTLIIKVCQNCFVALKFMLVKWNTRKPTSI